MQMQVNKAESLQKIFLISNFLTANFLASNFINVKFLHGGQQALFGAAVVQVFQTCDAVGIASAP